MASRLARASDPHSTIRYSPEKAGYLDHLVCHQCLNLLRRCSTPPAQREVPAVTDETYDRAMVDCVNKGGSGLIVLLEGRTAMEAIHKDAVNAVVTFPQDLRIERELQYLYPDIADRQAECLRAQVADLHQVA